jgi:hypothetical protein
MSDRRPAPNPSALRNAFAGRARGEVDFVFTVATACGMKWEEAVNEYKRALVAAVTAAMERIARAREARR